MKRWIFRIAVILAIIGIPFCALGGIGVVSGSDTDAVSGASTFVFNADDLSGEYVVLINDDFHTEENLAIWQDFFRGEDIPVMLEDLRCMVAAGDTVGADYAGICQARLPVNQMTVRKISSLLLLSKAEAGKFDVIVMSKEFSDLYDGASIGAHDGITMITVS